MKRFRWPAACVALAVFIITAHFVCSTLPPATSPDAGGSPLAFDYAIQSAFFALRCDWLNPLIIALTHLGDTTSIVIICLLLLIVPKTRIRYGIPISSAAIAASSLNHYLKSVFERPRPDEAFFLIEQGGWSFPSGHSISALVVFGLLILLVRKYSRRNTDDACEQSCAKQDARRKANIITALLLIPGIGIGLSRIYVGVHYPTDVLAGWCLGIIIITIVMEIMECVQAHRH